MDSVLIGTDSQEPKIMTLQVKVGNEDIIMINAYGPKEDDERNDKLDFWHEVEMEVVKGKYDNCMVVIEMDSNGILMQDMLKRHLQRMHYKREKSLGTKWRYQ